MLKERLNKFLNGDGDNKKKVENLIFLLIILIITIVAINFIWKDEKQESKQTTTNKELASEEKNTNSDEDLEKKLEKILSSINGVGNVNVMLTYTESTQIIPVYNKTEKTSNPNESDSGGGTRQVEESDVTQEVVYQDKNGKNNIITQKTISPKIEGAIITADGANNSNIKANIIQAVEAATGLATHKIQVFEKKNN